MKLNIFNKNLVLIPGSGVKYQDNSIASIVNPGINLNGRFSSQQISSAISNTLGINFEITENCNLDCYYCAFGKLYNNYGNRKGESLDINKAVLLLDFLHDKISTNSSLNKNKPLYIGFYGGEPTLRMDLIMKIISHVETKWRDEHKIIFSMTTNGLLLKKHFEYLRKKDFRIMISLDGNRKHNSYRVDHNGNESFERILSNIQFIQKNHPKFYEENITFNSVIHDKNNTIDVEQFFYETLHKKTRFSPVSISGAEDCNNDDFTKLIKEKKSDKSLSDCYQSLRVITGSFYKHYSDLLAPNRFKQNNIPTATCIPFSRRIHLTVDGLIFPCEKIGRDYSLGKVTQHGVELDPNYATKRINQLLDKQVPKCKVCSLKLNCKQCIFRFARDGNQFDCPDFTLNPTNHFNKILDKFSEEPELVKTLIEEYNEL